MAEDLEPDYLSDTFVVNSASDIRPGLMHGRVQKRHHEMYKKQVDANKRSRSKPLKVLEKERRDEALDTALGPTNKGFALLQKMGYKPGMSIGKQKSEVSSSDKLKEPIKPLVKNNRFGLGKETHQLQEKKRVKKWREQKVQDTQELSLEFQARVRFKRKAKQDLGDLNRSQKICRQLDSEVGLSCGNEAWFWPAEIQDNENSDQEDEEEEEEEGNTLQTSDQLKMLTEYLKRTYFYCLWCATRYDDTVDFETNCPGPTFEDHE